MEIPLAARAHTSIRPGTSLWGMEVESSRAHQLVLGHPRVRPVLCIIFGILLGAWGVLFWINVSIYKQELAETHKQHPYSFAQQDEELPGYAIRGMFLPIIGLCLLMDGLKRIASRRIFDGQRRAVVSQSPITS